MRRSIVWGLGLLVLAGPSACKGKQATSASDSAVELKSEEDKILYTLGVVLGKNALGSMRLSSAELELVKRGLSDQIGGRPLAADLNSYGPKIQGFAQTRAQAAASAATAPEKEKGRAFLEAAAKEAGAVRTPSGLVFKSLTAGSGKSPVATDVVKVNYRGTLVDGTEFDSSAGHGRPAEFPLNRVIPCWTEGLQLMKEGGKAKLVCPSEIAYGNGGQGKIPPGATLVFEVELLETKSGS